jgi:hypothetical protein
MRYNVLVKSDSSLVALPFVEGRSIHKTSQSFLASLLKGVSPTT